MPAPTVFLEALRRHSLLEPEQLDALNNLNPGLLADPKALAKELLQRGWLTAYQANQVLQGKTNELVLGSYVLLDRLGEGGMGAVFKARHQTLGRVVALKLIRKDRIANPATVKRFQREIRAAAQLNHPNIVLAFDADEANGSHFFTMEFVPGTDLHQLVKKDGPLPVAKACDYIRQAAVGLQHAFSSGMVHRDIKPHNLLLSAPGSRPSASGSPAAGIQPKAESREPEAVVKILDMGLARVASSEGDATSMLTQEGAIMGTPDFIAPEQAHEAHEVDIRADLYSLGCTFYYLLTGQVPFPGGSLTSKLMRHQMDEPKPVEQLRPEVPAGVAAIVRKMMAKKPADRFQTPQEVADRLAGLGSSISASGKKSSAAVAGAAAATDTMTTPETHNRPRVPQRRQPDRRRLVRLNAIGAGVLAVAAVVLYFLLRSTKPETPAPPQQPGGPQAIIPPPAASGPGFQMPSASWPDRPPEVAFVLGEERGRHWGSIDAVAYSPDGKVLATANGGQDNKVRFWDPVTLEEKYKIPDSVYTTTMAFSPNGNLLATAYNPPHLYDLNQMPPQVRSNLIGGSIIGFTADSRYLVIRSNKSIQLLDIATIPHPPPVTLQEQLGIGSLGAAFSGNSRFLAILSEDEEKVRVWDLGSPRQPKLKATVPVKKPGPFIALSPDGQQLAVSSTNYILQLWDLSGPAPKGPLAEENVQSNALTGIVYSPDGKALARGRSTVGYQLLAVTGGKLESAGLKFLRGSGRPSFSPDGRTLTFASGNSLVLWDLSEPEPKERLSTQGIGSPIALGLSRDGQTLAMSSGETFAVWDVASRSMVALGHTNSRDSMALHPDGKFLATVGKDLVVYYDTGSGKQMKSVKVLGNLRHAAFSPDGTLLAVNDDAGAVRLLDGTTGEERQKLAGTPGQVAFTADGKLLAASTKVFEVATGKEQCTLDGSGSIAFRPDGKVLALSGAGGTPYQWVSLCDPATGNVLRKIPVKGKSVAFNPAGRLLARCDEGHSVTMFDPENGMVVKKITLPGPATRALFTPDGQYLVTANANGTAYFLRVELPAAGPP